MKKSGAMKNPVAGHLALSLLVGGALLVVSPNAPADNVQGKSSTRLAKVAAVNFQDRSASGSKTPVSQVLTFGGGLLLAAFLVHAHARVVLRKSARM